ncbi:acyltransferase family protein [Glaciibacter superstes]|uniref:acyltransferase family protein n=1 Tax=Glaciibacter superstes TaxID=501023 RepID=UPI0003B3C904|nr:acyltransferase family protein [Glaciibacter superstes]
MTTATRKTQAATRARPLTRKLSFRSDLQGLRAIAVGLVLLYHSGVSVLSGGYVGVDAFFVISGFLITTHLLESLARDSRINFGEFYAKRARRILPASLFVAAATIVAALIWVPPLQMRAVVRDAIATAFYVPNMLFASNGTDYLAETTPSVFQHYWSLGVEEQFYIFWPLLIWLGYLLVRRSERRLQWVVATMVVASFVLCLILTQVLQPWAFFSLPTRAWELGVGGLVAFLLRAAPAWLKAPWTPALAWAGVAGLLGSAVLFSSGTLFPGFNALFPVLATAVIIIGGHQRPNAALTRILSVRPMQSLGAISYSLYLVHWPLLIIPQAAAGESRPLPLWLTLALGAVSIPVAYLLHRFVEKPFLRMPVLTRARPRRSLVAALIGSAVVIALAAGALVISNRLPLNSGQSVPPVALATMPPGTGHVPSNVEPSLRAASGSVSVLYDNGCHRDSASVDASGCQFGENPNAPLVFLFGDSHAEQWFAALQPLADAGQIRLDTNTKSSCPSVSLTREIHGVNYAACSQWRQAVIDRIAISEPSTVILANYGKPDVDAAAFQREWGTGLIDTIEAMPSGTRAVILADTPDMGESIPVCLSSRLDQADLCSADPSTVLHPASRDAERAASTATGATHVDLTRYLCNDASCPAVIGNLLVYRDSHHLTVEFSRALSAAIAQALDLGSK